MTPATTLILLRHGQTAANVPGDLVPMSGGRTDTCLSPFGEEQAALVAERLGAEFDGVPIYSSPLTRAVRTIAALAAAAGARVRVRAGLREIDCGALDGMAVAEVKRRYRPAWDANLRHDEPDFRWPGGESYREFRRRCLAEARDVAAAHAGRRVLLVTHAGVISQIVGATASVCAARWDLFRPGNASVTEVLWGPDGGRVVRFDDRTHLVRAGRAAGVVTASATTRPLAG